MNVLELLTQELKGKNWTLEEKARYIYIRSCELFSYDERYDYYESYFYDEEKIGEIRNRVIDLENVIDNRVICTSHAREVLSTLMKELLSIECRNRGVSHSWNSFELGEHRIMADATISSDLTRCKMGLYTNGYKTESKDYMFEEKIKDIDKKIGYIKDEYENYYIKEKNNNLLLECEEYTKDESLIYKLSVVKEMFEKYKKLKNYSDYQFCVTYLLEKFVGKDERRMSSAALFDILDEEKFELVEIFPFRLENEIIYYILEQVDNEYCFYEVSESYVFKRAKSLRGLNKYKIIPYD